MILYEKITIMIKLIVYLLKLFWNFSKNLNPGIIQSTVLPLLPNSENSIISLKKFWDFNNYFLSVFAIWNKMMQELLQLFRNT